MLPLVWLNMVALKVLSIDVYKPNTSVVDRFKEIENFKPTLLGIANLVSRNTLVMRKVVFLKKKTDKF
jgi:hypothetical protein